MISVATGRVDITPGVMDEMGGYGSATPRRAVGTFSPLFARVTLLRDDGPAPHVLVTLDAGTIPPPWYDALLPRLLSLAPWSAADIAIIGTHTHNAPMTLSSPNPWITYGATDLAACSAYWSGLADTVVELVRDVLDADPIPVTLRYAPTVQNWSRARTSPYTYTNTVVPVLFALDSSGRPRVVLFGYGTHAVTAGVRDQWDGDYPAVACNVIEAAWPQCHAQFLPGAGGDQDPVGTRGWDLRANRGTQLGLAVVAMLPNGGRTLNGPITTSLTSVAVPLDVPANATERAARVDEYRARIPVPPNPGPFASEPWVERHAPTAIARINAGTDPHVIDLKIGVWRFPGAPVLKMLLMSGEPVSGFGLWLTNNFGGVNGAMIIGYANGVPCYVVGDTFYAPKMPDGSYEGAWHKTAPRIAGGSGCVYDLCWHYKPGLAANCAEMTIINALIAALT